MFIITQFQNHSLLQKKLFIILITAFMCLFLMNSLHAQNSKNNTTQNSKSSSLDNKLIVASTDEERQQKLEEKKKQKEDKALEEVGKKEKTSKIQIASPKAVKSIKVDQRVPRSDPRPEQGYSNRSGNSEGQRNNNAERENIRSVENPVIEEHNANREREITPYQKNTITNTPNRERDVTPYQGNTITNTQRSERPSYSNTESSRIQQKFERNIPTPEPVERRNNNSEKPFIDQSHGGTIITPQSSDHVEQHHPGGIIPDTNVEHGGDNHAPHAHGNAVPNGHDNDWFENHGNHNHEHLGPGGYFHDNDQHDFGMRRHEWHDRYPFFTFYYGFDEDLYFPYDYLYYYPTDYVVVDSRLSVAVLPFTLETDETQFDNGITDDLIAALDDLHRFNLVGNDTIERTMAQNDIYDEDLVSTSAAKRVGRLVGADMVIMGTIDRTSDHITLTAQGLDPVTGEVIVNETATSDYTDSKSVARLVQYLAVLIYNDVPLSEGTITDISGNELYLNIGSNDGLLAGTRCVIYREGNPVRHPYTGRYLGQRITKVGEVYVDEVNDDNASARVISRNGGFRIGDKIIVK